MPPTALLRFGAFRLDPARRRLDGPGGEVRLGGRSMDLLLVLVAEAGRLVTHRELIERVWTDAPADDSALRVHLSALRRALGEGREGASHIVNEHGRGYRFVSPVAAEPPAVVGLPARRVRLIGRADLLDLVGAALGSSAMVTLVGPGGIGKSTVAFAAARDLAPGCPGGVHLVDLAAIEDEGSVPAQVSAALDASAEARRPPARGRPEEPSVGAILRALPREPVLLVLDNCEHVLGAVADLLDQLLPRAPQLRVLATSREPLRCPAERVLRLPGMAVPPADAALPAEALLAYPAVELFAERAAAACHGFRLTDETAGPVAALCRRLDGIPLAIEFAAGWIGMIPVEEIAAGLDSRLLTLSGGRPAALPRHRTLFAVLDWSVQTLTPPEREVLASLSVFRGGFAAASAVAICGASLGTQAPALLARLADKSLLQAEPDGAGGRFRLLETTRSYAARLLADRADHRAVRLRHARHCASLLEHADQDLLHVARRDWLRRYGPLVADVRSALAWCFGPDGDPAAGVALACASLQLGLQSRLTEEFGRHFAQALEHTGEQTDLQLRIRLSHSAAMLLADGSGTTAPHRAAQRLARSGGVERAEAFAAGFGATYPVGDYPAAERYAARLLALAEREGRPDLAWAARRMTAQTAHHLGRQDEARALCLAVLACPLEFLPLTNIGHRLSMRIILSRILFLQGEPARAMATAAEAREVARESSPVALCQMLTHAEIPLRAWSGDIEGASEGLALLRETAHAHALRFWIDWLDPLALALELAAPGGERHVDPIRFALSVRKVPAKLADFLTTIHPRLLTPAAAGRVDGGAVAWCAPEVLRARALDARDPGERAALLREARVRARAQGAAFFVARAERSLAECGTLEQPLPVAQARAVALGDAPPLRVTGREF